MSESLQVTRRDAGGTRSARRLRRSGSIPAILYGHGQENVNLAVARDQFMLAVRHGARLVNLVGDVTEQALVHDLQWDTYGLNVLHLDLTRVSEDETLRLKVSVELRGNARGATEGGVTEVVLHEIEIECRAASIPDKISINVNELGLGGVIKIRDLKAPAGVAFLDDADEIVVHCVAPRGEEETTGISGPAEPELIGRKPSDDDEESGD